MNAITQPSTKPNTQVRRPLDDKRGDGRTDLDEPEDDVDDDNDGAAGGEAGLTHPVVHVRVLRKVGVRGVLRVLGVLLALLDLVFAPGVVEVPDEEDARRDRQYGRERDRARVETDERAFPPDGADETTRTSDQKKPVSAHGGRDMPRSGPPGAQTSQGGGRCEAGRRARDHVGKEGGTYPSNDESVKMVIETARHQSDIFCVWDSSSVPFTVGRQKQSISLPCPVSNTRRLGAMRGGDTEHSRIE